MRMIYLVVLLLAGCASIGRDQNQITFDSNPPGATISSGNETWGVAPQTRIWTLAKGQRTAVSAPITATWISGAKSTITMNLQAGQEGAYTIIRPQGVAGLEIDVQWAMHLQQQETAKQASDNALLMMYMQQQNTAAAARTTPQPSPMINCTSRAIGSTVNTNCY